MCIQGGSKERSEYLMMEQSTNMDKLPGPHFLTPKKQGSETAWMFEKEQISQACWLKSIWLKYKYCVIPFCVDNNRSQEKKRL